MSGLLLRCVRVRCARMMCGCVCAYAGAHGCAWVRMGAGAWVCARMCVCVHGEKSRPPLPKKIEVLISERSAYTLFGRSMR